MEYFTKERFDEGMQWLRKVCLNQRGAFSPYMFGMIMGLSIFSSTMAYYARQDVIEYEKKQVERQKREADDLVDALETAILTETSVTYDADLSLNRAKNYSTLSSGRTRSGANVTMNIQDADRSYGLDHQRVVVTTSDDTLLKGSVSGLLDADDQTNYAAGDEQAVAMFDSRAARDRQVSISYDILEQQAALVYQFYARTLRFPNASEYDDEIAAYSGLTDYWDNEFTYTYISDTQCRLSFTTPWGYTQSINLDL